MTSLPLAPDRAVVSNRISMLLANRASLFKSLTQTARDKDKPRDDDDDDWLSGAGRPNEGVGYVAGPSENVAGGISGRAGRVLGKGKRKADDGRTETRAESDDDDEGRCGVGRRKRQRQDGVDGDERQDRQEEVNVGSTPDLSNSHHAATNQMEPNTKKKKKKAKKRKT